MDRGYSQEELRPSRDTSLEPRGHVPEGQQDNSREQGQRRAATESRARCDSRSGREGLRARTVVLRRPYRLRHRTYRLRDSEIQGMTEIGKFRVLAAKDLGEFAYAGNRSGMERDLRSLRRQSLIEERRIPRFDAPPQRVVVLTKEGRRLLFSGNAVPGKQALYYGFSKPRDALHDAELYRLYQKAAKEVLAKGGRNIRVILEAELMRTVYRDLVRAERNDETTRSEIAAKHGLKVIHGRIPMPDLQIEYETPERESARVNLELATKHYDFGMLAQKVQAGFSLYARSDDLAKLRRILDERELIAEIMSL